MHEFVLARRGNKIELVGTFRNNGDPGLKLGESFERMPGAVKEDWTVIKVFDHREAGYLQALSILMGFDTLKKFFEVEV